MRALSGRGLRRGESDLSVLELWSDHCHGLNTSHSARCQVVWTGGWVKLAWIIST